MTFVEYLHIVQLVYRPRVKGSNWLYYMAMCTESETLVCSLQYENGSSGIEVHIAWDETT